MTAARLMGNKIETSVPRKLFIGPAGCGKSEQLLKAFEERLSVENPLDPNSYFIVPSKEHAERIIKLLIIRGSPGFFSNRVTTLDDLIEQCFEVPNPPAVSNLSKIAIVRRILSEEGEGYFGKIYDKPGFLNLILNFLNELKDFCWTPEAFRLEMGRLKKLEPEAALKYEALAGIYERYEEALRELGLRDRRDTLAIFQARKAASDKMKPLHFHTLCLDGFFDFTPVQMEAVSELANASEYFFAALTWDKEHASIFEPVTATKKMFDALGFEVCLPEQKLPRFHNQDLAHLSRNLFSISGKTKKPEGGLDWFQAPDLETEAEMIARRILFWMSEKNCRPGSIAVLLRSVRPYRAVFEAVFRRFGIPVEIHERERLSESEWIQTSARLVRLFKEDWKKEDWLGFLRSSFVTRVAGELKDDRKLHSFEASLRRKGILSGAESWKKAAENIPEGQDISDEVLSLWFSSFSKIESEWKSAKTTVEWTRFFKQLLFENFGMLEFLSSSAVKMQSSAAAPARFEKILEEMERSADRGADSGSFEKFSDDFLRLVELDLFSLPNLNQNAVQIYDVSLARQKEYEVVFVAGLAEKQFPLQVREDALLSDWERRLIQKKPYGLPERKARQQLEKYLFYIAVTRARQHVCLSHARRDEEGKPVLPSFYLEELTECFEGAISPSIKKDTQPYPSFSEILNISDLKRSSIGALFNPWENPRPDEVVLEALLKHAFSQPEARSDLRKALAEDKAQLLDERLLKRDIFHPSAPSPTRLEAYAKCSYRYFSEKILKLQETEEDTRARNQGIIMHGVLEDFFKGPWKEINQTGLEAWIDSAMDRWILTNPLDLGPYQTSLARVEIKNILLRFIRFEIERLESSSFQPRYFEYEIPKDKPVLLKAGETTFSLQGKIDRIDIDPSGEHFMISDYKRARSFEKASLEEGTSLQLPLYLLAVQKLLGLKPAGAQLLNMKDLKASGFYSKQVVEARKKLSEEEFDAILRRAAQFSFRYLKDLAAGKIAVEPRDCMKGCGYASLCRIEKWKLPEIAEKIREEDKKLGF